MSDETTRQIRELKDRVNQLWKMETSELVVARYQTNAGQSIPNNSSAVIDFEDLVYDTHSAVTVGAAWVFTAPVAGYYAVSTAIMFDGTNTWADGEIGELQLYKNAGFHGILDRKDNYVTGSPYMQLSGSDVVHLGAGETLHIQLYQNSGAALALYNTAYYNYVEIHKV